jgi:hypothetical protein
LGSRRGISEEDESIRAGRGIGFQVEGDGAAGCSLGEAGD